MWPTMKRGSVGVVLMFTAAIASSAVACSDSGTGPTTGVAGEYVLVSLNEQALLYSDDGCCIYVGGLLELQAHTYRISVTAVNPRISQDSFTEFEEGEYAVDGNVLRWTPQTGTVAFLMDIGQVDCSVITVPFGDEGPGSNQFIARFRGQCAAGVLTDVTGVLS